MRTTRAPAQSEIDSAWKLWQALLEHAETLWHRYEEPFSERILRQKERDEGQDPPFYNDCPYDDIHFSDDDIPF